MEKELLLFRNELTIPCKISVPDFGQINQVVLGIHGFGGSTEDAIQVGIAEEMTLFSSAVIRFDFPAHGSSPMSDTFFTLKNCVDSLLTAAAYAKGKFPHVMDLCIFATGFGAYVVLTALQDLLELSGSIRLVVQTPSVMMHETLLKMARVSRETFRAIDKVTIRAPRPFDVSYQFLKDLEENIVMTSFSVPMLILHGEQDDYIRMEDIQQFHGLNEDSKLVIIPGASHQFKESGAWDMVLDLTRDWFEFQQVLLSDWS